jgi:hypothetical protein
MSGAPRGGCRACLAAEALAAAAMLFEGAHGRGQRRPGPGPSARQRAAPLGRARGAAWRRGARAQRGAPAPPGPRRARSFRGACSLRAVPISPRCHQPPSTSHLLEACAPLGPYLPPSCTHAPPLRPLLAPCSPPARPLLAPCSPPARPPPPPPHPHPTPPAIPAGGEREDAPPTGEAFGTFGQFTVRRTQTRGPDAPARDPAAGGEAGAAAPSASSGLSEVRLEAARR